MSDPLQPPSAPVRENVCKAHGVDCCEVCMTNEVWAARMAKNWIDAEEADPLDGKPVQPPAAAPQEDEPAFFSHIREALRAFRHSSENRSPDGDGQSDMTASQQMLSPRVAGSEPADSHSPLQPAAAAPPIDLDLLHELLWASEQAQGLLMLKAAFSWEGVDYINAPSLCAWRRAMRAAREHFTVIGLIAPLICSCGHASDEHEHETDEDDQSCAACECADFSPASGGLPKPKSEVARLRALQGTTKAEDLSR